MVLLDIYIYTPAESSVNSPVVILHSSCWMVKKKNREALNPLSALNNFYKEMQLQSDSIRFIIFDRIQGIRYNCCSYADWAVVSLATILETSRRILWEMQDRYVALGEFYGQRQWNERRRMQITRLMKWNDAPFEVKL